MKKNIFSVDEFFSPDRSFHPVYSWMWNEALSKDEIKNQLDSMHERGIGGAYVIPLPKEFRPDTMTTALEPSYLSDGYFEMLSFAADYANKKGMRLWLYDEGGWPSGNANGLVIKGSRKLRLRHLEKGRVKTSTKADLTSKEATEKFIALTHEKHKEKMGDSFKKLGPLVFTDEPDIKAKPFTKSIKKEYKNRTGKRLTARKLKAGNDPLFNIIYHDICAELFAENYFAPIKKWCNEQGFLSAGHLDKDNELFGLKKSYHHPLRQLRLLDVPGVDVIWGQIAPDKECGFFPRLASSAAEQSGSGLSLTESLSVYGTMTYEQIRYVLGYQLVRGINVLNLMLMMYNEDGYYCVRQRPSFSKELPGSEHLPCFNRYLASLQYLMQRGKPATDCALYLPMRSLWADDKDTKKAAEGYELVGKSIEKNHGQFDIIDDDLILGCDDEGLQKGVLAMGRAEYTAVYIPADKYMPDEVRARLDVFVRNGGKVYRKDNAEYKAMLDISGDEGQLRVHKRKYDSCELYLVFNEGADKVRAEISLPEGAKELDAANKKIYSARKSYCFESGEIKIFITGDIELTEEKAPVPKRKVCSLTEFMVKQLEGFTLSKKGMSRIGITDSEKATGCGEWSALFGKAFSGRCQYKASFSYDGEPKDLLLSLGEVHYSCEVILNGIKITELIMPPYEVLISKELIRAENELVINLSNTAANAFVSFSLPYEWEKKQIGPYHERALSFEKELVSGGLLGPVEIYEA